MKILFILPNGGRSGGIKVSVEMANHLLRLGHDVRIAHYRPPFFSKAGLVQKLKHVSLHLRNFTETGWLYMFDGIIEPFSKLEDLRFPKGEVVLAVGEFFVNELLNLSSNVYKVRYCHGFAADKNSPLYVRLRLPMQTICVSEALVPTLEELCSEKVVGVVPNGINTDDYFVEKGIHRDGIGTIFGTTYEKAPEDTLELLNRVHDQWPCLARYVFGSVRRPKELPRKIYCRYPSVEKSRELYNRSKIWLVTSRSEGFCLPILEAMACGSVVISTRHDNASNLISHEENGFLVPVGDIEGFMHYIELILNDEDLRRRIADRGHETVSKFTWSVAVENMLNCLHTVVENGHIS